MLCLRQSNQLLISVHLLFANTRHLKMHPSCTEIVRLNLMFQDSKSVLNCAVCFDNRISTLELISDTAVNGKDQSIK